MDKQQNKLNKKKSRKLLKEASRYSSQQINKYERLKKREVTKKDVVTEMKDENNILEIEDLNTYFFTDIGVVKAVDGVSFNVPKGATVGVVGESGCGKSVTSLSIMRLVQGPTGQIVKGDIRFPYGDKIINLRTAPMEVIRNIRGNDIAMIFQEPMTSLNPVFTTGYQIDEVIKNHHPELTKKQIRQKSIDMLDLVGISRPKGIYKAYPHELSGGMRQRALIAMALACDPKLIIADEPTTALDVTIQAQVLDILRDLKSKINASIILITHDLGVVAEMADYVVVMYAGRIIEQGTARDIYKDPRHPYTVGLIKSRPNAIGKDEKLYSIPGQVPNPINMPKYCYFKDRCNQCTSKCNGDYPELTQVSPTHFVACWKYEGGNE
ncbi:ABC transporter ATP-binding protein [Mycoplasmatota bacterium]|nr:ABC transporter ATP-binding protein [Mycoplasmatota bacterium]